MHFNKLRAFIETNVIRVKSISLFFRYFFKRQICTFLLRSLREIIRNPDFFSTFIFRQRKNFYKIIRQFFVDEKNHWIVIKRTERKLATFPLHQKIGKSWTCDNLTVIHRMQSETMWSAFRQRKQADNTSHPYDITHGPHWATENRLTTRYGFSELFHVLSFFFL